MLILLLTTAVLASHFQSHMGVCCKSVVKRLLFVSSLLGEYSRYYWLAGFGGLEFNPHSVLLTLSTIARKCLNQVQKFGFIKRVDKG